MNEERKLAEDSQKESPIWETIEETHSCYNSNLELLLNNLGENDCVFIASHNGSSCELALQLMEQNKIGRKNVRFGQLKAFSD